MFSLVAMSLSLMLFRATATGEGSIFLAIDNVNTTKLSVTLFL